MFMLLIEKLHSDRWIDYLIINIIYGWQMPSWQDMKKKVQMFAFFCEFHNEPGIRDPNCSVHENAYSFDETSSKRC